MYGWLCGGHIANGLAVPAQLVIALSHPGAGGLGLVLPPNKNNKKHLSLVVGV